MNFSEEARKGLINVSIGAIFWGLNAVFVEYLFTQKGISPEWLASYRLLVAGLVLLGYLYLKEKNKIFDILKNKKDLFQIIIFGMIGMLGVQYSYFITIKYSNAGIATTLQYLGPTLILLYVCFKEKRKPKNYEIIALIVSMLGVFILATHGNIEDLKISTLALIWGFISAVTVVVYNVQATSLIKKYSTPVVIAWALFFGGITLSTAVRPWEQNVEVDFSILIFFSLIVLLGTIFSFFFYLSGVTQIGATKASMIACIEPVVATICSVVFMGSSFGFLDAVGFVFIMSTVFIVAYYGKENNNEEKNNL